MKKSKLAVIFEEIFQVTLIGYLTLLLVETIKEGFVSNFFNINILLGVLLFAGIGMAIFPAQEKVKPKKSRELDWIATFFLSILAGGIIFYKTRDLGNISYIISATAFLLVFLLSYLLISNEDKI